MMALWLQDLLQTYEARYYFCFIISLVALTLASLGFYFTNQEQKAPQYILLVTLPLAAMALAAFLPFGLPVAVLAAFFFSFASIEVGGAIELWKLINYFGNVTLSNGTVLPGDGWIPWHIWKRFGLSIVYWSVFYCVLLSGFYLVFSSQGYTVTTKIYGGSLILLGVFAVITSRYLNHANFFRVRVYFWYIYLGNMLFIVGYAAYTQLEILSFLAMAAFAVCIGLHFYVDGSKRHGFRTVHSPVVHAGSYRTSVYPGASHIPLGLALATAAGFSAYTAFASVKTTILWTALFVLCYGLTNFAFIREKYDDYTKHRKIAFYAAIFIICAIAFFPVVKRATALLR